MGSQQDEAPQTRFVITYLHVGTTKHAVNQRDILKDVYFLKYIRTP